MFAPHRKRPNRSTSGECRAPPGRKYRSERERLALSQMRNSIHRVRLAFGSRSVWRLDAISLANFVHFLKQDGGQNRRVEPDDVPAGRRCAIALRSISRRAISIVCSNRYSTVWTPDPVAMKSCARPADPLVTARSPQPQNPVRPQVELGNEQPDEFFHHLIRNSTATTGRWHRLPLSPAGIVTDRDSPPRNERGSMIGNVGSAIWTAVVYPF